ncbi:hypothetical protein [Burkholderia ambifaria]|uniref:hypothetical protein n=1 Tax=Burkholderia ambifaria TaxID=152480 RepID=UPI00158EB2B9|nr:hypothetical protein [Burkholderia ambifaria]
MWFNRLMPAIALVVSLTGCVQTQLSASPGVVSHTPSEIQYAEYYRRWQASQPPSRNTDDAQRQMNAARLQEAQRQAQTPEAIAARDAAASKQAVDEARMREREESAKREAARSRPNCSTVRVSGIAGGTSIDLDALRRSPDPSDLIARHPLQCQPSGMTQTYACRGGAWFAGQTGYVIAWSDTGYQIATPVDLIGGRKDALVFVRRSDAVCLNNTPPSLEFVENLHDFLRNHNRYR